MKILLLTLLITSVLLSIGVYCASIHFYLGAPLVFTGSALWAAIDSKRLNMKDYNTSLGFWGHCPVGVFAACTFLWLLVFPCYLVIRHEILNNLAKRQTAPQVQLPHWWFCLFSAGLLLGRVQGQFEPIANLIALATVVFVVPLGFILYMINKQRIREANA
ncbi:MAG: hypothetical protein K2Z81_16205 [Cyanobacteria bacterium]|nr:hypothetical protein [Cyanobacteriota bacterium]